MSNETPDNERDQLWNLLGHAQPPKASPFFARNILRQIHETTLPGPGIFSRLAQNWRLTLATGGAVVALLFAGWLGRNSSSSPVAIADEIDYEAIDHLDELLAYQEESVWMDGSVY